MEKLISGNLKQLEGRPEYEEKTALFELFKDRLKLYGFQPEGRLWSLE